MSSSHRMVVEIKAGTPQAMVAAKGKIVLNSKFVGVVGAVYMAGRMDRLTSPDEIRSRIDTALRRQRGIVPWTPAAIDQALRYLEDQGKIQLPQAELVGA